MKNRYILILLSFFAGLFYLSSCDQKIDNFYTEKARIQFKYFKEDTGSNHIIRRTYFNNTTVSFGMSDDAVLEDTAKIVVEFLGSVSDRDRLYKLRIGPDSTTAVEGVHYKPFAAMQTFRAGRMKDTLKIVVLRSQLSSSFTNPEDRRLVLEMEPTEDFNLGMKDGLTTNLYINNYLSKPIWWDNPALGNSLGYYHPKKWRLLISFNQKWADKEKYAFDINSGARPYFDALRNYLESVPTFDDETGGRIYMYTIEPKN